MPRAPKACPRPGCPKAITQRGRCEDHQFPMFQRNDTRRELTTPAARARRLRVLDRDGWKCRICGEPANEADHVVAHAFGGADHEDNMAALCTTHHRQKTAQEAVEARRRQARQRRQT